MTPPHRLDYSPGRPPRKWVRRLVMAVVGASVIGTGVKYWPAVRDRAAVLYWQRQCMNFQPPGPGTVVYDDLPTGDIMPKPPRGYLSLNSGILPGAAINDELHGEPPVLFAPVCWRESLRRISEPYFWGWTDAIVFLHARRSPKGLQRLVAIGSLRDDHSAARTLAATVVIPGGPMHAPVLQDDCDGIVDELQGVQLNLLGGFNPHKIFAGAVDPTDESKFTIEYEWDDGIRGVIDGQLMDTGHVNLTIRPGPGDYDSYEKRTRARAATQPPN